VLLKYVNNSIKKKFIKKKSNQDLSDPIFKTILMTHPLCNSELWP